MCILIFRGRGKQDRERSSFRFQETKRKNQLQFNLFLQCLLFSCGVDLRGFRMVSNFSAQKKVSSDSRSSNPLEYGHLYGQVYIWSLRRLAAIKQKAAVSLQSVSLNKIKVLVILFLFLLLY